MDFDVIEGAPLPFSFDILTTAFHYGNRVFPKYPDHIPEYFKKSFPEGYTGNEAWLSKTGEFASPQTTLSK